MTINIAQFIDALQAAPDIEAIWQVCAGTLAQHGFSHVTYLQVRLNAPHDAPVALTTMPDWWADTYLDAAHIGGDPFFRFCGTLQPRKTGVDYLAYYPPLTPDERERVLLAGEAGCRTGFASPVRLIGARRCGGWNFGSDLPKAAFDLHYAALQEQVQLLGFYAHERLDALYEHALSLADMPSPLSRREQECLTFLAAGSRTSRIADALSISANTVAFHLNNAKRKLGASTREEALAKAIAYRHITLST